jgi:predicted O-linked N-acetylglucosamine transferase (SPINDLY family)
MDVTSALLDLVRRHVRGGAIDAAAETLRRALDYAPDHADALALMAQMSEIPQGEKRDRAAEALGINPQSAPALALLAGTGYRPNRLLQRALVADPGDPGRMTELGLSFVDIGQLDVALGLFGRAIMLAPQAAGPMHNCGCALLGLGQYDAALDRFRQARLLDPALVDAWINEGMVLQIRARHAQALDCYIQARALAPQSESLVSNMGFALRELERFAEAVDLLQGALTQYPTFASARVQLGISLRALGRTAAGAREFVAALCLDPAMIEGASNLAQALVVLRQPDRAQAFARRASILAPTAMTFAKAQLFLACYASTLTLDQYNHLVHTVVERLVPAFGPVPGRPIARNLDPARPLSIGYLSSDFRRHPVMRNLMPLLQPPTHSGDQTEGQSGRHKITLFNLSPRRDEVTDLLADRVDRIIPLAGLLDDQIARAIIDAQIDILVVLAGRFDDNRLWIGRTRPAPILVSMCDVATTGFDWTDYLIADPIVVPACQRSQPDKREFFSERVLKIPHVYAHDPIANSPDPGPAPSSFNGYLTFGSLNNPGKINASVLGLWGRLLREIPQSRLLLHYRNSYDDPALRTDVLSHLGVDDARVIFSTDARADLAQHLALYQAIDIGLDPYPFNGSTTSFEALWMGVPVLGPIGDRMISRWNASLMTAAGLGEFIARTPDHLIELAKRLDGDREMLGAIRARLRGDLTRSYVCNSARRRRDMDRLYQDMWRRYCQEMVP